MGLFPGFHFVPGFIPCHPFGKRLQEVLSKYLMAVCTEHPQLVQSSTLKQELWVKGKRGK